ncbi:MAG: HEPN domain-containing protein [Solirubrobacterales bacterium]
MTSALPKFNQNLTYAKDLHALALTLQGITTGTVPTSDLLRGALVGGVSALDDYVHTVVRTLIVEVATGLRPATDAFEKFNVPLRSALLAPTTPPSTWLTQVVLDRHSHLSFQDPEKIADAIRLVSAAPLWDTVGAVMGLPAADVKTRLKLIVARRNQIVHEADCDPTPPHSRWPITAPDVGTSLTFIEDLVTAIDAAF